MNDVEQMQCMCYIKCAQQVFRCTKYSHRCELHALFFAVYFTVNSSFIFLFVWLFTLEPTFQINEHVLSQKTTHTVTFAQSKKNNPSCKAQIRTYGKESPCILCAHSFNIFCSVINAIKTQVLNIAAEALEF